MKMFLLNCCECGNTNQFQRDVFPSKFQSSPNRYTSFDSVLTEFKHLDEDTYHVGVSDRFHFVDVVTWKEKVDEKCFSLPFGTIVLRSVSVSKIEYIPFSIETTSIGVIRLQISVNVTTSENKIETLLNILMDKREKKTFG
jgi:hypothetical protein